MIPLSQALSFENLEAPPRVPQPGLTDEEQLALDYADSCIESAIFKHFHGDLFNVQIPAGAASLKVLEALKRKYEAGGWTVGLLPVAFDGRPEEWREFRFVLSPAAGKKVEAAETDGAPKGLPRLLDGPNVESRYFDRDTNGKIVETTYLRQTRLLVRMPTRTRPEQALRVLGLYRELAGMPIQMEVVIDEDDASMLDTRVLQRLNAMDCVVTVGAHKSKIEAVNGGRLTEWDILLLASDDMWPVKSGWAIDVVNAMEEHWPHLDGAIFQNDGYARDRCCTLPIFGKRLWQQFGEVVYEPTYRSLWCDLEQTELLRTMGRLVYVDKVLIEHRHPETRKEVKDALYIHNYTHNDADRQVYEERAKITRPRAQYAFDAPPQYLSILIATVPNRRARLERLLDHLWAQILALDEPRMVEIVVDAGGGTIGEKRQRMLEKAKGRYVAHVDDDDWTHYRYVSRIVKALQDHPLVDCLDLNGIITTNGERPEVFRHSFECKMWETINGVHYRCPNHLNVVRRELALEAGFKQEAFGEDFSFSTRLRPLLKSEASLGEMPSYFYWARSKAKLGD
jgi:hypothetical protein